MSRSRGLAALVALYLFIAHVLPVPDGITAQGWRQTAIFITVRSTREGNQDGTRRSEVEPDRRGRIVAGGGSFKSLWTIPASLG